MSGVTSATSFAHAASGCDGFTCCVGCVSLVPGLLRRVVDQVTFFPPRPPGYHLTEDRKIYLVTPQSELVPLPDLADEGIAVDTVRMWTRRKNTIHGFHFRRLNPSCTLLFSHGNSTDIGIMFDHFQELSTRLQVDVFAYDYSGYGDSTGLPSEADLYTDIEAAYAYLTRDAGVPPQSIVLYGQSIGSAPSIDLATRCPIGGIVLQSALKTGLGLVHDVKATYWFDVFKNVTKIEKVQAPIFVIHGTHDDMVPFEHGVALYEAAPKEFAVEPWWVKEAGHNDIEFENSHEYFAKLRDFVEATQGTATAKSSTAHSDETQVGRERETSNSSRQPLLGSRHSCSSDGEGTPRQQQLDNAAAAA